MYGDRKPKINHQGLLKNPIADDPNIGISIPTDWARRVREP